MLNRTVFGERPEAITYIALPDGGADIWLRKNIRESVIEETGEDGEAAVVTAFAADEAYMRGCVERSELEADFDGWFERAAAWKPTDKPHEPTAEERIAALERENAERIEQLNDTQLALCEIYEMIGA